MLSALKLTRAAAARSRRRRWRRSPATRCRRLAPRSAPCHGRTPATLVSSIGSRTVPSLGRLCRSWPARAGLCRVRRVRLCRVGASRQMIEVEMQGRLSRSAPMWLSPACLRVEPANARNGTRQIRKSGCVPAELCRFLHADLVHFNSASTRGVHGRSLVAHSQFRHDPQRGAIAHLGDADDAFQAPLREAEL